MSVATIFIIGTVIFAITVYGTVMAGGLYLTRVESNENAALSEAKSEPDDGAAPRQEPGR